MEDFNSLTEILKEFPVKETTIALFEIDPSIVKDNFQVAYAPQTLINRPEIRNSRGEVISKLSVGKSIMRSSSSDFNIVQESSENIQLTQTTNDESFSLFSRHSMGDKFADCDVPSTPDILDSNIKFSDSKNHIIMTSDFTPIAFNTPTPSPGADSSILSEPIDPVKN